MVNRLVNHLVKCVQRALSGVNCAFNEVELMFRTRVLTHTWSTGRHVLQPVDNTRRIKGLEPSSSNGALRIIVLIGTIQYLSDQLQYVADILTKRRGRFRSSTSNLDVRLSRCVTVDDRSFATAGSRLWNSLPADVRFASSLTTFRQKLKTHLFRQSYPDIVL